MTYVDHQGIWKRLGSICGIYFLLFLSSFLMPIQLKKTGRANNDYALTFNNLGTNFKMYLSNIKPFPIEHLPPLLRNAVIEMHRNTGFSLPLIASSSLSAISAAIQNVIDVQPPVGSISPVSLFMVSIAESGEGKTPIDGYFTKPIRDFEENENRKMELKMAQQMAYLGSWEIELNAIEAAIKKNRKKSLATDDPVQANLLNAEFEKLEHKLTAHFSKKTQQQARYKLLHSNTTPPKIAFDLHKNVPSAYLSSDEAGSLFRGEAMKDLGMFNKLWDGTTLHVDRLSSPSFQVKDARLSIFLAVQWQILQAFLVGRGKGARDIGFIARCLVSFPLSTKGSRLLNNQPQNWEHLKIFQQRITAILIQDKLEMDQGRGSRRILKFSEEAKEQWIHFRNQIELDLNPGGYLAEVHDGASKIANNVARMAALFHFFEECEGDISAEVLNSARLVCAWYLLEFKRLFSKTPEIPFEVSDVMALEEFFRGWGQSHPGFPGIRMSAIAQYGPAQLRKDSYRRGTAINLLISQNKIHIQIIDKKKWIAFNPGFFSISGVGLPY